MVIDDPDSEHSVFPTLPVEHDRGLRVQRAGPSHATRPRPAFRSFPRNERFPSPSRKTEP